MLVRLPHVRLATTTLAAWIALLGSMSSGCDGLGGQSVATEELTSPCPKDAELTGKAMGIQSPHLNVRTGPGTSFERVVDQKRSRKSQTTEYVSLTSQVTILEECRKDGWSRVWVTQPEHLRATHHGWVANRFLTPLSASAAKLRTSRSAGKV